MRSALSSRVFIAAMVTAMLAACGGGGGEDKKATQVAAKVNSDEITVHQINAALPRLNNPSEAQLKAATSQVLERLIDQQLFIQKAVEGKLDRDPQVLTAIENARREIMARAYVERVMSNAAKADPAKVKEFYTQHPELFSERKVYRLQEVAIQARGPQLEALKAALGPMNTLQQVVEYAKANSLRASANTSVRAAEQLPMELAAKISKVKDGELIALPGPGGVAVVQILASQPQPLDEAKAQPFIEQYLQNRVRMELAQAELKNLRAAAKIDYMGDFQKPADAAAAPPAGGESLEQQATQQPGAVQPVMPADPQPAAPATPAAQATDPQSAQHQEAMEKGLSGLKK